MITDAAAARGEAEFSLLLWSCVGFCMAVSLVQGEKVVLC